MAETCICPPAAPAQNVRNYYQYYDTPDGCDIIKKVGVTTRYGLITGVIAGTYDVLLYSHAVGLGNVLKRYALHTVPLGLMGATFAVVANGVQNLRQKDDTLNYFIGGFACSPILAAYLGSKHALVVGGILMGIAGMVKKDAVEAGASIFPNAPGHMGMVNSWRHDWSIVADPRDEMVHNCGMEKKKGSRE